VASEAAPVIAHYRHRDGAREAIAAPGEATSLAAAYTPTQAAWGRVTSRRPKPLSQADIALLAFKTGVKPAVIKRAIDMGLFRDG
jgi:hypothetical protein